MDIGSAVWYASEDAEVWRPGEVISRNYASDGSMAVTVRPTTGGPRAVFRMPQSAETDDGFGALAAVDGEQARVMQRNVFASSGGGYVGVDDLIMLPHLNEPAILEVNRKVRDRRRRRGNEIARAPRAPRHHLAPRARPPPPPRPRHTLPHYFSVR